MYYDVFMGRWPEYIIFSDVSLAWEDARKILAERLCGFRDDPCPCCREDGMEAYRRLLAAQPGRFEAEIDGDDYLILPSSSTARMVGLFH